MNYKIVIDPGHGGSDSGAVGNGIIEKDMNLDISNYMYSRFEELGIPVITTRTTDVTLDPTTRVKTAQSKYGNSSDVILISNHINAGGGEGAEVIYALRNNDTLASSIINSISDSGQVVRKYYQLRLPSDSSKDYYYIIRDTKNNQTIIVEYGFLDTVEDANRLKSNWKKYAEAVVEAVTKYIGKLYIKKEPLGTSNGVHTVVVGDTLWSIAKKYNVSVDEIKKFNDLSSNMLSIGQQYKIPNELIDDFDSITYVVKSGDTLYEIAKKYRLDVQDILSANNLVSTDLFIGQQLILPNTQSKDIKNKVNDHIVVSGDSLYSIAQKYDTTVSKLMSLNNLNASALSIGQILKIDERCSEQFNVNEDVVYKVVDGDTLWSIANNYGVTASSIQESNNLLSSTLSIGQILLIPNKKIF